MHNAAALQVQLCTLNELNKNLNTLYSHVLMNVPFVLKKNVCDHHQNQSKLIKIINNLLFLEFLLNYSKYTRFLFWNNFLLTLKHSVVQKNKYYQMLRLLCNLYSYFIYFILAISLDFFF